MRAVALNGTCEAIMNDIFKIIEEHHIVLIREENVNESLVDKWQST